MLCAVTLPAFARESLNKKDSRGMRQGRWVARYPGGTLKYEGSFSNNKAEGEWKRYHENGKLKALMIYRTGSDRAFASLFDEEGNLYAKGVFEGINRDSTWNFYSGDKVVQTENYRLGKKSGPTMGFDHHGTVLWEREYKEDILQGKSDRYALNKGGCQNSYICTL